MKPGRNIYSWILAATLQLGHVIAATTVDLGYATYEGYYNDTYDLNIWKSLRYAAPPVGKLRWQAPQPPLRDDGGVIPAVDQPPICPQSGAFGVPEAYGFNSGPGDEDCLYLNVYAAPNATSLPVLVWIHGGGYSVFGAAYDPSIWMNTNNNGFIVVEIQYRLGAFGYLASDDVKAGGRLNAGLLDQRFALEWVQEHISKFGGDPTRVTIGGESSGAGSIIYHALAYGGKESNLFNNIIAASPYLPPVHRYNDTVPTAHYDKFVELVGCDQDSYKLSNYSNTFECLVAAESAVLQNASGTVSTTQGYFGSFAFLPVIDYDYIRERPSAQFLSGNLTGKRLLVGNNANDGVPLTDPEVDTRTKFDDFVSTVFPLLTTEDIELLNNVYQIASLPIGSGIPYDTLGFTGPTALYQSGIATGIQQAAFNLAAENTFACPAQWFAEAFTTRSRQAWKYQYSVTPSYHGADLNAYFSVDVTFPNVDFRHAMQKIWGNFIINNSPIISISDATANYENATVPIGTYGNIEWPEFTLKKPVQMNLNTTGGNLSTVTVPPYLSYYVREGFGIVNTFNLSDAFTWEGGRGERCEFWRIVSKRVPQ
ncbi:putative carboxylesterase [Annulohypoxylon maeteangense]|uniref:putative carboxylesterase n=1 Tax=Annulohypoxylon maeteangense TaxID=1927788 RepID=UPI0020077993|nr:putative carboxylesterase [Annulohypoxylon maeteangense]KAI0889557.1 putative carboxylesterase [Annulohypoxylon maeteangense]